MLVGSGFFQFVLTVAAGDKSYGQPRAETLLQVHDLLDWIGKENCQLLLHISLR